MLISDVKTVVVEVVILIWYAPILLNNPVSIVNYDMVGSKVMNPSIPEANPEG